MDVFLEKWAHLAQKEYVRLFSARGAVAKSASPTPLPEVATPDMIWAMGQAADVAVSAETRARMWQAAVEEFRKAV